MRSASAEPIIWPPERFVEVGGARIHYRVQGEGPAAILVHGLLGHSFSWRRNAAALASQFRVYMPDLPGLGYSEVPASYRADFAGGARFLCDFAGAVGEDQFALCGHSYGGAIALLCAARCPERVRRLALVCPANPFSRHGRWQIRIVASRLGPAVSAAIHRNARLVARLLLRYRLYGRPELLDAETIAGYLEPMSGPDSLRVVRRMAVAWDMAQVRAALSSVICPVLLVWGERDRVVPVSSAAPLAEALRAPLEVLRGYGHMVTEEAPAEVNALLLRFLAAPRGSA